MPQVVPLDVFQTRLLDALASELRSPPADWPSGVRAASLRISVAMETREVPDAEDLCRVLFLLLDADRVSGYLEDRRTGRPVGVTAPEVEAVHVRFDVPLSCAGSVETLDGATVYFFPS